MYSDHSNGGSSVVDKMVYGEGIRYKYTLKEGVQYPFSGIAFFDNTISYFDLSHYDYVKIKIKASQGKRLPFIVSTYLENYTNPNDYGTFRDNQAILNVDKGFKEIRLTMTDLKTPEWWYTQNHTSETDLGKPDFSKVKTVSISNCVALGNNKEDIVEIQEISFHVNLIPFFVFSLLIVLLYYSVGFFLLKKKKETIAEINFVYEKTESVNHLEKNEEAVFHFLTSNYHHEALSIIEVQNTTGISEQKISALIRKRTGKNFKQFLNKLRITEAKRLLRETDLQVSEIAFKVGYANVSHFNRVFKDLENYSPNDFRKQESHSTIN